MVAFSIVTEIVVAIGREEGVFFQTPAGRIFNIFCFFTIQSNIILGVTSLLLALRLDRRSTVFAVFRLDGVLGITVTGLVYNTVLTGLFKLEGIAVVTNFLLHVLAPLLGLVGWLLFGPRRLVSGRIVGLATIFPLAWLAFTLLRGPIVDFYPYPFVNVIEEGYARVLLNCLVVALLFLGLAAGLAYLDGLLLRWQDPLAVEGQLDSPDDVASASGPALQGGPDERRLQGEPPPGDEPVVGQSR